MERLIPESSISSSTEKSDVDTENTSVSGVRMAWATFRSVSVEICAPSQFSSAI